jgi:hypothetical protein
MVQTGDGPRLADETLVEARLIGVEGGQHFDRHVAVEAGLVGFEDGRHAARADLLDDAVLAQRLADQSFQPFHRSSLRACHRSRGTVII